jgi:opine dehydrogenase
VNTVAVLGGGNGAFAAAADLALRGAHVRLFEAPEMGETVAQIRRKGGIDLVADKVPDVTSGFARLDLITDDPGQAMRGAELVLYVVPAFAEARFTELCGPYLRPEQLVVMFCGGLGAALQLVRDLKACGIHTIPTIAETEGLVYGSAKQDATTVRVLATKKGLRCAALPSEQTGHVVAALRRYYPDFVGTRNVIETGLRNLNPVVHGSVSVLNAGRTAKDKPKWRYYWDGVTEAIGRVLSEVDKERLAIGTALGLELPSAMEVLLAWYGRQGACGSDLGQILSSNPPYETVWAPESLEHRFITEDIPYGLVPIEAFGGLLHVDTPAITSLITLASLLLDIDFRANGRNLKTLGLDGIEASDVNLMKLRGTTE